MASLAASLRPSVALPWFTYGSLDEIQPWSQPDAMGRSPPAEAAFAFPKVTRKSAPGGTGIPTQPVPDPRPHVNAGFSKADIAVRRCAVNCLQSKAIDAHRGWPATCYMFLRLPQPPQKTAQPRVFFLSCPKPRVPPPA